MCIIIDINCLPSVFKKRTLDHDQFKPVRDWIFSGRGKLVYGGSKYYKELATASFEYIKLFTLLRSKNLAISVPNQEVDFMTDKATKQITHPDFDDQHLVGLLLASKCKLICSKDERAYPYFKHPDFFAPASNRPKIYTSKRTEFLLSERHIAKICQPCGKLTKTKIAQLEQLNPVKQ